MYESVRDYAVFLVHSIHGESFKTIVVFSIIIEVEFKKDVDGWDRLKTKVPVNDAECVEYKTKSLHMATRMGLEPNHGNVIGLRVYCPN